MNAQDLKNSILQLAIQGKLVEQRREEGTAEELYPQIFVEKAKLIKEGKIKKEKPLTEITEDEIPFEIPENWKWMRIPEMSYFQEGPGILAVDFRDSGIPLIRISGMQGEELSLEGCNYLDFKMVERKWDHYKLDIGDILISTSASMDKICEVTEKTVGSIPYTGQIRFKMYGNINKNYFKYFIKSSFYAKQINEQKSGGTIKHYGPTHLQKMIIPIPPLEEQKRIVAKIEELLPYVEKYGEAHSKLEVFNKKFSEDMQKSILQYAIQGKLVEQLVDEGTAEALYQQIQEEKVKLIKEGKLKKEKPLPAITEDEIPFDIPDSWKWIRLRDLGWFSSGKTPSMSKTDYWENGDFPWVTSKDMKRKYINSSEMNITQKAANEMTVYPVGTLLMVVRSGILKRQLPLAILTVNSTINQDLKAFTLYDSSLVEYVYYTLKAMEVYILKEYRKQVTTVDSLKFDEFQNMPIPIPPVKEQKRILRRLEEVLQFTHNLIK
ncbi:restriction endonuclease subunit S [Paenibacillus odorifer]|uniref:restriction endonuclease subunit S n=1 Tax=Paenibacillus TaxID=44249 RepID=UPI00096DFDCB|nr:restriction endonuclease subunit S [Paenibacillus odorifer]OME55199.1 hypothetical protein BSK61_14150 [Paenibacillus odorifer]